MRIAAMLRSLWRTLARRRHVEQSLDDEVRAYVELLAEEYERGGLPPEVARRRALVETGGVEQVKEATRAVWTGDGIITAAREVRFTLRALRRNAGYAVLVIATLAVGVGGCATVFSVLPPFLLRPLPFADAGRLVQIGQVDRVAGYDNARHSLPQYADWRERSRAFDDLAAYTYGTRNLTGDGTPIRALAAVVTGNMFPLLGTLALRGRTIVPADAGPGGNDVVVLSYALWAGRYAADPAIVGRGIRLDGRPYTVIGVMPAECDFPVGADMWAPLDFPPAQQSDRANHYLQVIGSLKPSVSLTEAQSDLRTIAARLAREYPATNAGHSIELEGIVEHLTQGSRQFLTVLMGAAEFVLLLACSQVGHLHLALECPAGWLTRIQLGPSRPHQAGPDQAQLALDGHGLLHVPE